MNRNAEEIFMRMLAAAPLIFVPSVPAVRDEREKVIVPEVPFQYRERTDAELDVFVAYAVRADAACKREHARHAAAHPTPRPSPITTPYPEPRPVERSRVDKALERIFG